MHYPPHAQRFRGRRVINTRRITITTTKQEVRPGIGLQKKTVDYVKKGEPAPQKNKKPALLFNKGQA